jgi:hypothetical protein
MMYLMDGAVDVWVVKQTMCGVMEEIKKELHED